MWGTRTLAITDKAVYNIDGKRIKRCLMIHDCKAMTKTVPPSENLEELTIHVTVAHDYRFRSNQRDLIMDVIKRAFFNMTETNVQIYCV